MTSKLEPDFVKLIREKQQFTGFFSNARFLEGFHKNVTGVDQLIEFLKLVNNFDSIDHLQESILKLIKNDFDIIRVIYSLPSEDNKRGQWLDSSFFEAFIAQKSPEEYMTFFNGGHRRSHTDHQPYRLRLIHALDWDKKNLGEILAFIQLFPDSERAQAINSLKSKIELQSKLSTWNKDFTAIKQPLKGRWWRTLALILSNTSLDVKVLPSTIILPQNLEQLFLFIESMGCLKSDVLTAVINPHILNEMQHAKRELQSSVLAIFQRLNQSNTCSDITVTSLPGILKNWDSQHWQTILRPINWSALFKEAPLLKIIRFIEQDKDVPPFINALVDSMISYYIRNKLPLPIDIRNEIQQILLMINQDNQLMLFNLLLEQTDPPSTQEKANWEQLTAPDLQKIMLNASPKSQNYLLNLGVVRESTQWALLLPEAKMDACLQDPIILTNKEQLPLSTISELVNDSKLDQLNRHKLTIEALKVHGVRFFQQNQVATLFALQHLLSQQRKEFDNLMIESDARCMKEIRDWVRVLAHSLHDLKEKINEHNTNYGPLDLFQREFVIGVSGISFIVGALLLCDSHLLLAILLMCGGPIIAFGIALATAIVTAVISGIYNYLNHTKRDAYQSDLNQLISDHTLGDSKVTTNRHQQSSIEKIDLLLVELNKLNVDSSSDLLINSIFSKSAANDSVDYSPQFSPV